MLLDEHFATDNHHSCFETTQGEALTRDLLLLDSCSTVCVITIKDMLHNIHRVQNTMTVQCNAGIRRTNQMGWIGSFPEPVWYDPGGAANIMSLQVVTKHYDVFYDSTNGNKFTV